MIYWFFIFVGVFFLSVSLSKPVYNLVFKKYNNLSVLFQVLIRAIAFFLALLIIFIGLYIESAS